MVSGLGIAASTDSYVGRGRVCNVILSFDLWLIGPSSTNLQLKDVLVLDGININVWPASGDGLSSYLCYVRKKCGGSQGKTQNFRLVNDFKLDLFLTPIMNTARARYSGPSRKLVIALDIGTTFSGAAYALLDPGEVPEIQSVTRQVLPPTPDPVTKGDERGVDT